MQLLRELRGGLSPSTGLMPQKIGDLVKVNIKGFVGVWLLIPCVRAPRLSAGFFSVMVLPVIDIIGRYPVETSFSQRLRDEVVRLFLVELANLPVIY